MNKTDFSRKIFLKQISAIAIPVALQNLLNTTGSMVDTMMISSLGELSVGAVGLCAQFTSLMFSSYWGFVGGGMLFFSQYWGAKDHDGINRSYGMTLTCLMTVGFIFGALAIFCPEAIMRLYTDKKSIQEIGVSYLKIVGFAFPLQTFSMSMASLLRSTERVKIPLVSSIVAVFSNCFINYILIFGNFGAPAMGVRGAALATVISNLINVILILIFASVKKHPYILCVHRHFRWNRQALKEFFTKCFPIIVNEVGIGIGGMIINIVLGHQIEEAIAATAVFRTLEGLVISFFSGFSNASSILVGKEVGAGNLRLAYERAKRIIYLCQGIIAVTCIGIIALHTPILRVMNLSGTSFNLCFGMIVIYGIVAIIRMGNWSMNDTYRAAGDAITGTVLEILYLYTLVVPAVVISGFVFHAPFLLIFALCYCDEPIRYVFMQRQLYSGRWIRPVTPQGELALESFQNEYVPENFRDFSKYNIRTYVNITFRLLAGLLGVLFLFFFTIPFYHGMQFNSGTCVGLGLGLIFLAYAIFQKKCIPHRGHRIYRLILTLVAVGILTGGILTAVILNAAGKEGNSGDTLVVLGCRVRPSGPSRMLSTRIDAAYDYLINNPDAVAVLSGGKGEDEPVSEAECMFEVLVAKGIDPNRLYLETKSTSTIENLHFSMKVISENGLNPQVSLVTNEFHQCRAQMVARGLSIDAGAVSAKTPWFLLPTYLVREWMGVVCMWIFG